MAYVQLHFKNAIDADRWLRRTRQVDPVCANATFVEGSASDLLNEIRYLRVRLERDAAERAQHERVLVGVIEDLVASMKRRILNELDGNEDLG